MFLRRLSLFIMGKTLIDKIALGTVQFGLDYGISNSLGRTLDEEVSLILDIAANYKIKILDTAQAYGTSEEVLGKFHYNRFDIVTKINPLVDDLTASEILQRSLSSLNVKKLYAVLFHNAQSALSSTELYLQLMALKEKGVIRKLGYSVYYPEELVQLIEKNGLPDLVQIPFSHLDRRFESIAKELHELGVEIHSRSTFLQGLFFLNIESLSSFFEPIGSYLKELQNKFPHKGDRAAYLLNYVVSKPFIDKVIIGVNDGDQLKLNLEGLLKLNCKIEIKHPNVCEEILIPYLWK